MKEISPPVVVTSTVDVCRPLAFAVGVMLTTFGTFWGAEGAGVDWPGDDASLPVVLGFVVLVSLGYVTALRRRRLALA